MRDSLIQASHHNLSQARTMTKDTAVTANTNDNDERANASHIQTEVIPDENTEVISADAELTRDMPDDTEDIDLVHLRIQSMEDLELHRFSRLRTLCLRQNLIESMGEVDVLPTETLVDIDLYDNKIKHISSNIGKLTNLKNLDLSFNKIKHIKNLESLVNLENLYFVQNKISKIENLGTLKRLKNLELGGNLITELTQDSLKGLDNLEEIWLGKNMISRLENLQHLKNLRILSIQSNKLTKIQGLEQLENLEELYLSHNYIEKIEGLDKNTKLTTLDITSNRISKVENLKNLTKLTDLWLSFNKVDQSFESLGDELRHLPEFETIYLEGNPIQTENETTYRRKLVLNLGPSLQKIDATYIRG